MKYHGIDYIFNILTFFTFLKSLDGVRWLINIYMYANQ